MLPPIFAVYCRNTGSIQVLQVERGNNGQITRLRTWVKPTLEAYKKADEADRDRIGMWVGGTQWYCVPQTGFYEDQERTQTIVLYNKVYTYWSLHHSLVWSNPYIFAARKNNARDIWERSPTIPVLEFEMEIVYNKTQKGIYPYWCDGATEARMAAESEKSWTLFRARYEHVDPTQLRIRTPTPKEEDELLETPMPCIRRLTRDVNKHKSQDMLLFGLCIFIGLTSLGFVIGLLF